MAGLPEDRVRQMLRLAGVSSSMVEGVIGEMTAHGRTEHTRGLEEGRAQERYHQTQLKERS